MMLGIHVLIFLTMHKLSVCGEQILMVTFPCFGPGVCVTGSVCECLLRQWLWEDKHTYTGLLEGDDRVVAAQGVYGSHVHAILDG